MSEQERPPKLRLLVGIDLTERSRVAFSRAVELARAVDGPLTLVHVTSDLFPPKLVDEHDSYARDVLEEHVLKARAEGVSEVAQAILYGRDYEQLIEQARKDRSDLIVVGRHRPASLVQDMLGTTVDRVLRLGGIPVLVTPVGRGGMKKSSSQGSHGRYPDAMLDLAKKRKLLAIDLTDLSEAHYRKLGYSDTLKLFVASIDGKDDTHFLPAGALEIAKLVAQAIKTLDTPLAKQVVGLD